MEMKNESPHLDDLREVTKPDHDTEPPFITDKRKSIGRCVTSCPDGYKLHGNLCLAPPPNCQDIIPVDSDFCLQCKNGFFKQGSKCNVHPTVPHVLMKGQVSCQSCASWASLHQATSKSSGKNVSKCLTKCPKGHFYNPSDHSCRGHSCVSKQCPEGMRLSKDGICDSKCDFSCLECQDDDSSICLSCPLGKHLLFGKCVDKCPEMFYSDLSDNGKCMECHWACSECQGPTADDCIKCGSGKLQQNGRCVAKCSEGFYEEEHSCLACPGGCTTCNNQTECYTCRGPYFLKNYQCTTHCGAGYYTNNVKKTANIVLCSNVQNVKLHIYHRTVAVWKSATQTISQT
ncbi:Proprotein convertase subtilisin/kexin type 5 [Armadillidium vulgare]|nr:Proprotein convertase subtilisin/kexin type 5 [Armadillidium vulgare]